MTRKCDFKISAHILVYLRDRRALADENLQHYNGFIIKRKTADFISTSEDNVLCKIMINREQKKKGKFVLHYEWHSSGISV